MKRKRKRTLKTILLSVLGVGAIVGVASGINTLVEKQDEDLKTIHPLFEVGCLNSEGKYEETEKAIYTKTAFECQGLEVKLDFDNTIDYQVFFYESDGDFISATNVLTDDSELDVPILATHARLVVTPNWLEMGEEYEDSDDRVIKWYETAKYSSQLELKVNKKQYDYEEITLTHLSGPEGFIPSFIYHDGMTWEKCVEINPDIFSFEQIEDEDLGTIVIVCVNYQNYPYTISANGNYLTEDKKVDIDANYALGTKLG